LFTIPQ